MRTIWKISVPVDDQPHIFDLPPGPIVHAGLQHLSGQVEVWVEVETEEPALPRAFQCFGTGHPIPADADYVGTSIDGPFVWHVYEVAGYDAVLSGPIARAKIEACKKWVAEHPEYPDGTIAVAEINDGGGDEIIQRIDGRWCYAGLRAGDYPLGDSDWIEIHGVIHTPPTVRDHLNAIGFTDEQITEAAGVVVGSGRPLPASMLEIIDRWTQIEMLVGNPTPQWVYDEIARRTEYDYQYEPAERLKIIDGVVRDIAMGRLP